MVISICEFCKMFTIYEGTFSFLSVLWYITFYGESIVLGKTISEPLDIA